MTNRDVQFKAILDYIRANYAAAIDVPQMASAAGVSERECYRIIELAQERPRRHICVHTA